MRSAATSIGRHSRRYASGEAVAAKEIPEDFDDLESHSSIASTEVPEDVLKSFDPIKRAKGRKYQLPASRYGYITTQWALKEQY
jgi:large subunit ribosomal protein L5